MPGSSERVVSAECSQCGCCVVVSLLQYLAIYLLITMDMNFFWRIGSCCFSTSSCRHCVCM